MKCAEIVSLVASGRLKVSKHRLLPRNVAETIPPEDIAYYRPVLVALMDMKLQGMKLYFAQCDKCTYPTCPCGRVPLMLSTLGVTPSIEDITPPDDNTPPRRALGEKTGLCSETYPPRKSGKLF